MLRRIGTAFALALGLLAAPAGAQTLYPAPGAGAVNPDVQLKLTFAGDPAVGRSGKVRIYDAADDRLVDELDLSIPAGPTRPVDPAVRASEYLGVPYPYDRARRPTNRDTRPGTGSAGAAATDGTRYQLSVIGGFTDGFHFYPVTVNGRTATIHPHHDLLRYGHTYYVQVDPQVLSAPGFKGVAGKSWRFTTKARGPAAARRLVVSPDGRGDFDTVQGALDFTPDHARERITITVRRGLYQEIVYARNKDNITLEGQGADVTVVRYANNEVLNPHPANYRTNERKGTFPSRRAAASFDNVRGLILRGMTFQTTAPGQSEGLLVNGERNILDHVTVIGGGDALQINGPAYVVDSRIEGTGDTILGRGPAFFERTTLRSTRVFMWIRNGEANHGNVFKDCTFVATLEPTDIARSPTNGAATYQDRDAGIQSPGPQALVSVDGSRYLVVANSGANTLLVFPLRADGSPDIQNKQTYFTGTNPVDLAVTTSDTDLNGDDIPDLAVVNEGSNDVSIFVGQVVGGVWTLAYRPRQSSAGNGPTSVAIGDVTGDDGIDAPDGRADLLVSNGQSNNVSVLPNRGDAFFINQQAIAAFAFQTGFAPSQVLLADFDGVGGLDLITVNTGSNDLTVFANFLTAPTTSTIASGGTHPVAAVAFQFEGAYQILVANTGNGVLETLRAGVQGFEVVTTQFNPAIQNLSDLAVVSAGNELAIYGTDAGRNVAELLATFSPPAPPSLPVPAGPGNPAGAEVFIDVSAASSVASPTTTPAVGTVAETVSLAFSGELGAGLNAVPATFFSDQSTETIPPSGGSTTPTSAPTPEEILLLNLPGRPRVNVAPPIPPEEEEQEDENESPRSDDSDQVMVGVSLPAAIPLVAHHDVDPLGRELASIESPHVAPGMVEPAKAGDRINGEPIRPAAKLMAVVAAFFCAVPLIGAPWFDHACLTWRRLMSRNRSDDQGSSGR